MLGGDRTQRGVVARRGPDDTHVAGAGFLVITGRDLVAELFERLLHSVNVVVWQHNRARLAVARR